MKCLRVSWGHALAVALAVTTPAGADSYGRFQHGGRGVAQAGAWVARASDPLALAYNPAGLLGQEAGWQLVSGLDFDAPSETFSSAEGVSRPNHSIQFPPLAYLSFRPSQGQWAAGIGIDAPIWRLTDWNTALFPARFTARKADLRLFSVRVSGAYQWNEMWSIGGGIRYLTGASGFGDTVPGVVTVPEGTFSFEVDRTLKVATSGWGLELGIRYSRGAWGWGATYRSAVEVEGRDEIQWVIRDEDALPPSARQRARLGLPRIEATLFEELPEQIVVGGYWSPYPELALELDLAFDRWSATRHGVDVPGAIVAVTRRNGWHDVVGVRIGLEGALWDSGWKLGAGLGYQPTPARPNAAEPGTAQGDAVVYALGATYELDRKLQFELGYSFHDHKDFAAREQTGTRDGLATYRSHAQVFAISFRWRR